MRQRLVTTILSLMALGLLWPGLGVGQAVDNQPAHALAVAVVGRLSESSDYTLLDSLYENNQAKQGEKWTKLPEAQAIFLARQEMLEAARSATIESNADGSKVVAFSQAGRKIQLTSVVPSEVENNAEVRNDVAGTIVRFIVDLARDGVKYQAASGVAEAMPTSSLAVTVLRRLTRTPEYVKLDSHYENAKRDRGDSWVYSPEGMALAAVRGELKKAALSAKIETIDGRRNVVYTQRDRKIVLSTLIPEDVESDPTDAAEIISDFITEDAPADANYQAVVAAIDLAEEPPLPEINRSSATLLLGVFVEPQAPSLLWLPAPGPSTKAELLPQAEAARQRGLQAAGKGDWPAAVAAFKAANQFAHCSPPLIFNLALAYQRGGWSIPAAMWYRAYLAALPEAPKAAEIRGTIQQLIAETETRALREFDEAVQLAELLPETPAAAGVKSLRQSAFETMAFYAYAGGLVDRGDALVQKALALPDAREAAGKLEYPDRHGLYAAAYAWDTRRLEEIIAGYGQEYPPEMIFNYRINAWGNRGDLDEVRKIVEASPAALLSDNGTGVFNQSWINTTRAYEVQEIMHGRKLDTAKELYVGTLLSDLHNIFWDGRPDIAQRLARRALEHYRKLNPEGSSNPRWDYTSYLIPNAILGEREAIVKEMRRWKSPVLTDSVIEIAALYMVASMTPADAEATIMEMVRLSYHDLFLASGINIPEENWPNAFPEAYFALAIAKGDSRAALKYLEGTNGPADEKYQARIWRALRFAVATGRSQLAFDLSKKSPLDLNTIKALNRLAANPGAGEPVKERVRRFTAPLSGGWRPSDAEHARKVGLYLKHANWLKNENEYGLLSADAETVAQEKPEQLPANLAGHAVVLWMGAMAARLED